MGASKKKIGSQKKPSKSKAAQAAADRRRQQRKATGQAAQKDGKYKSIKPSAAATRARSRASERRKKSRQQAAAQAAAAAKIRAAEKAAANKKTAVAPGTGRSTPTRTVRANTPPPGTRTVRANTPPPGTRTIRANTPPPGTRTGSRPFPRVRPQPKPTGMSLSRFKAGLYNLLPEGMRQAGPDTSGMTAKEKFDANPARQAFVRSRERRKKRRDRAADNVVPPKPTPEIDDFRPELPPEIVDEFPPVMPPQFPQYPGYGGGMMGGLGAFGYNPALMAFESQQGAGQVPYYMAAARNAMTPNMSPAFMHASRNYDILGGMQRTAPRPMEMMSAAERAQIAGMSNFSTPNYNSPYDQFNFFSNMVGGGGGKGMGRPMPQMGSGLGAFYGGFA